MRKVLFGNILKEIAMLLCIVILSGCGTNEPSSLENSDMERSVTLMTNDITTQGFEDYINEVQRLTGLEIALLSAPINPNDRLAKFHTILSSGDSSVDVLSINDEMLSQFIGEGYLAPLEQTVVTPDVQEQLHMDYITAIASANGHIYSVPQHAELLSFWVDERILQQTEIESITTQADFEKYMKACGDLGIYGYGGAWEKTYASNEIYAFVLMFGGDVMDWTNPKSQEAVKYLYDLVQNGYTPVEQTSQQYEAMMGNFIRGDYGCILMWNTFTQRLIDRDRYGAGEIQMRPLPLFSQEEAYMATWHYVLNRACENNEPAQELLRFFASKEGQMLDAESTQRIPARKDALYDPSLQVEGVEQVKYYLENYKIHARPMAPDTMPFIEGIGNLFQKYIFDEITLEQYCIEADKLVALYI